MSTGERIATLMIQQGLTVETLGNDAEMSPKMLQCYIDGTENLTLRDLERVCDALGVTMVDFFSNDFNAYRFHDRSAQATWDGLSGEVQKLLVYLVNDLCG